MIKEQICQAFCDDISITEVPVGLAIRMPFTKENGDPLVVYLVWEDGSKTTARLEDDGDTMPYLEASGVDFSNEIRRASLVDLLNTYGGEFDEDEYIVHTDYFSLAEIPMRVIRFATLLVRLQDFLLNKLHAEKALANLPEEWR